MQEKFMRNISDVSSRLLMEELSELCSTELEELLGESRETAGHAGGAPEDYYGYDGPLWAG